MHLFEIKVGRYQSSIGVGGAVGFSSQQSLAVELPHWSSVSIELHEGILNLRRI